MIKLCIHIQSLFCKYRTAHRKQQTRHMFVFLKFVFVLSSLMRIELNWTIHVFCIYEKERCVEERV